MSRNRRFTVARGRLDDYRTIRSRYNCDVNDVVLAVIAGALRNWLLSRGESAAPTATVRAMAPLPVYVDERFDSTGPGQAISQVAPFLVDLPVGEGNAVVRLSQIAHTTETNPTAASLVDARTIATLSGFAPPTLHAMGIRVATGCPTFSRRTFNLLITNAPGAQSQMYIAGAKLLETYAVPPLLNNQVLAIGVTSYNGMLYYGINADRDAMSDVDMLPVLLGESLDELLEASQIVPDRPAGQNRCLEIPSVAMSTATNDGAPPKPKKKQVAARAAHPRSPMKSMKPNCSVCKRNS